MSAPDEGVVTARAEWSHHHRSWVGEIRLQNGESYRDGLDGVYRWDEDEARDALRDFAADYGTVGPWTEIAVADPGAP